MKMNSIIGFAILIIGTFSIILIGILLITVLWQNQKIQGTISPIIDWLTPKKFSNKGLNTNSNFNIGNLNSNLRFNKR